MGLLCQVDGQVIGVARVYLLMRTKYITEPRYTHPDDFVFFGRKFDDTVHFLCPFPTPGFQLPPSITSPFWQTSESLTIPLLVLTVPTVCQQPRIYHTVQIFLPSRRD